MTRQVTLAAATVSVAGLVLAGCGSDGSRGDTSAGAGEITVTNCGADETFPSPAERIYVNDGNMTSMLLSLGAQEQIIMALGLERHSTALSRVYGKEVIDALPSAGKDSISLEHVLARTPDVMVAGWNYGYKEENNLTPESLKGHDIAPYVLSESCRQEGGARGTMPPWDALYADLENLGKITGREDAAADVTDDIERRLTVLEELPQPQEAPTVFLFDSASKDVFTSGAFGGPHAIIEAAGATNGAGDVQDTWTRVSWERLVTSEPDFFVFVDYPGQTYAEKVSALESNPATRNLPAVKDKRYLNLPYVSWTSSPLNIDAAEQLRASLEEHDLVPESDIGPAHDLEP